jgi:uncharacterized protein (DUF924 family)
MGENGMGSETEVREFWFGSESTDAGVARARSALWWQKNAEVDAQMRERFQPLVDEVGAGLHRGWSATAPGALALILLSDQFPRNIYRDTPRAFAFDALALAFARTLLDAGFERKLRPIERVFCYLPFEHSEVLADQDRSVELFTALQDEAAAEDRELFAGYLDFARRHRSVIQRFGRFPHRNRILGRVSTAAESAFLQEPGSSF